MKKFFIIFIGTLFIMALIIAQCNGDDSYDEDEMEEEEEIIETPSNIEKFVGDNIDEEELPEERLDLSEDNNTILDESDIPVQSWYESTSLEIPRLTSSKPEQILVRAGYTTSYNKSTKNANWVAWHLTSDHTSGRWSRDGIPYMVDMEVKGARQELEDWYDHNLPIDHGHLCPAGDCKWSKDAMEQSFLLTNMCPQNSNLNRGDWEQLESRCRGWARHYGELYIACGPIFYSNDYITIGNNKVGVPDAFYKVVLHLGKKPQALGFIYPNEGEHHNMQTYVTTVDKVEEITGIDFFYNLPDEIENQVESTSNFNRW